MSDFAVSAREATARSASSGGREPLTTMRWVSGGPWSTAVVSEVRRWPPVADRPRANRRRRSRTRSWGCSPGPRAAVPPRPRPRSARTVSSSCSKTRWQRVMQVEISWEVERLTGRRW